MDVPTRRLRQRLLWLLLETRQGDRARLSEARLCALLELTPKELARELPHLSNDRLEVRVVVGGAIVRQVGPTPREGLVREVYDHWRRASGHAASRLTSMRARRIRARLAEGYSPERLRAAIDGILGDSWYRARGLDDLELALRSGEKLERFERLYLDQRAKADTASRAREEGVDLPASMAMLDGGEDDGDHTDTF